MPTILLSKRLRGDYLNRYLGVIISALVVMVCVFMFMPSCSSGLYSDSGYEPRAKAVAQREVGKGDISRSVKRGNDKNISGPAMVMEVTAYTWTGYRTASGQWPKIGMVAARDLPLGARLYIDKIGMVTVTDRMPKDSRAELDLYMLTEKQCMSWGRREIKVWRVD
jgi:3D (Asp-Asp-Asp) domain-containing protein